MAQTQLNYNQIMSGEFGETFRKKTGTVVSGAGNLAAGTIVVLLAASGKYTKWDSSSQTVVAETGSPDTEVTLDTTRIEGVGVLLEAAAAASADADAEIGISGTAFKDKLVLAGSNITTVTDYVEAVLQCNGIYVKAGSNAMAVAGE